MILNDPHHLARVLQLQRHLREAWHQMRSERFDLIYRPLLSLIDDDILPRFTDVKVLREAELLMDAYSEQAVRGGRRDGSEASLRALRNFRFTHPLVMRGQPFGKCLKIVGSSGG